MTALTPDGAGMAVAFEMFAYLTTPATKLRMSDHGAPVINFASEAELRTGLAKLAFAYGWQVREEVVIPGWGRIDLVLHDYSPTSYLIELKQSLTKPSDIRKAFQQADGYGRWWTTNREQPAQVILAAAEARDSLIKPVAAAYPEVQYLDAGHVMDGLAVWGAPEARVLTAGRRSSDLAALLQVHEYAVARLEAGRK